MRHEFSLAVWMAAKQYLRNPLFIFLLIGLPPTFITLAFVSTPDAVVPLTVREGSRQLVRAVSMPELHGAIMVPITVSFLSGMLGLFMMFSARQGDRRLIIAGYPPTLLLIARLVVIAFTSIVITLLSIGITLLSWQPKQLLLFFLANLLPALQYAFLGAIAGTFLSSISGTYLMFFLPMIDVGLVQNPMFPRQSADFWVKLLPDYPAMEVLVDASFSSQVDADLFLVGAALYTVLLGAVAGFLFRRAMALHR